MRNNNHQPGNISSVWKQKVDLKWNRTRGLHQQNWLECANRSSWWRWRFSLTLYVSMSYVKGLFEKISACLKQHDIITAAKGFELWAHQFSKIWKRTLTNHCNRVDCEHGKPYIGQTQRRLKTTLYGHKMYTKNDNEKHSALSKHGISENHIQYWSLNKKKKN